MYCKHCGEQVSGNTHNCSKKGLLNVHEDNSFLVSSLAGLAFDNGIVGGLLGGDLLGGVVGDLLNDGELF